MREDVIPKLLREHFAREVAEAAGLVRSSAKRSPEPTGEPEPASHQGEAGRQDTRAGQPHMSRWAIAAAAALSLVPGLMLLSLRTPAPLESRIDQVWQAGGRTAVISILQDVQNALAHDQTNQEE